MSPHGFSPSGHSRCAQVPRAPGTGRSILSPSLPLPRERPGAHPAAPDPLPQACGKGSPQGGRWPRWQPALCARRVWGAARWGGRHFLRARWGGGPLPSERAGPLPGPGEARAWRGGEAARAPCGGREGMPCACALRPPRGACARVCVQTRAERRGGREPCAMTSRRCAQDVTPA